MENDELDVGFFFKKICVCLEDMDILYNKIKNNKIKKKKFKSLLNDSSLKFQEVFNKIILDGVSNNNINIDEINEELNGDMIDTSSTSSISNDDDKYDSDFVDDSDVKKRKSFFLK